jgi:hypothetical protein
MKRLGVFLVAAAVIGLLAVSAAAGGKGGTDRPFKATFAGAATYTFPLSCSASGCDEFTTHGDGTGQAIHMGRVEVHHHRRWHGAVRARIWNHRTHSPGCASVPGPQHRVPFRVLPESVRSVAMVGNHDGHDQLLSRVLA